MSDPNADLIAVILACPKDPKSPYRMGSSRVCSVGNLRRLERHCNSGPINLGIFDIYSSDVSLGGQTVSDYHPLFLDGFLPF